MELKRKNKVKYDSLAYLSSPLKPDHHAGLREDVKTQKRSFKIRVQ